LELKAAIDTFAVVNTFTQIGISILEGTFVHLFGEKAPVKGQVPLLLAT
jgi:hypothetical protein